MRATGGRSRRGLVNVDDAIPRHTGHDQGASIHPDVVAFVHADFVRHQDLGIASGMPRVRIDERISGTRTCPHGEAIDGDARDLPMLDDGGGLRARCRCCSRSDG